MKDFFISYNRVDENWAEWIAWQLEEAGYSVIIQAWDFKVGENFVLEMQQAAAECGRTIVVLSPNYMHAQFTQPEWAAAFAQDPTGEKGSMIPIRVQPCALKGLQKVIIYIDLVGLKEDEAKNRLLAKIKSERAKPTKEPIFPGTSKPTERTINIEPEYPGIERSDTKRFQLKRCSMSEERKNIKRNKKATGSNKAAWIGAIALMVTTIIAGLFTLTPMLCNKQIIDFELNGSHFHPNSFITIKIKGTPSIKNEDLVILLDGCSIDYCLEKKAGHWQFNPAKCNLSDELLKDGKHELSLRLANTEGDKKYLIYFDSEPPPIALEKTVETDESATIKGITADKGLLPEDTINVHIMLWNGDSYERTELPVNKYVNKSGQVIWGFQVNVKRIPKLEQDDPNYSKIFCRIQVNDKAKNIASYELPYSQVFAKGVSRTMIGDTEILMGSQEDKEYELHPKVYPIDITAPPIIKKPLTDTDKFTLVIYVFSPKYAEIGVKNLPNDAIGKITYFKNDKVIQETEQTKITDQEVEVGDFYKYYATVAGKENKIYQTNIAFSFESEMVFINAGTFQMGSNEYKNEQPIHKVSVSSYYISKYEITQKQWHAVMGSNPSYFKGDYLPVENVSWEDCQRFIRELNKITGIKYRLPTETEWEYAARGGNRSYGFKYCGSDDAREVAWYKGNSGGKTHPIGGKKPNEVSLFDMSGNVWEWCADWYERDYHRKKSVENQKRSTESTGVRVLRGGSWLSRETNLRCSLRYHYYPSRRYNYVGFRLVR